MLKGQISPEAGEVTTTDFVYQDSPGDTEDQHGLFLSRKKFIIAFPPAALGISIPLLDRTE